MEFTMSQSTEDFFLVDPYEMRKLENILKRLYDDRPLSGDDRRDLANSMDCVLSVIAQSNPDIHSLPGD